MYRLINCKGLFFAAAMHLISNEAANVLAACLSNGSRPVAGGSLSPLHKSLHTFWVQTGSYYVIIATTPWPPPPLGPHHLLDPTTLYSTTLDHHL